jgi:uncharacterized protein (TIGR02246 family)
MDDTQAIQVVLDGFVTAWNHHDMNAFGELFDDDATFVNICGMLWRGHTEIEAAHKAIHSSLYKGSQIQNQVESVRFLSPEVAITLVRSDLTGDERSPGATRQTICRAQQRDRIGRSSAAEMMGPKFDSNDPSARKGNRPAAPQRNQRSEGGGSAPSGRLRFRIAWRSRETPRNTAQTSGRALPRDTRWREGLP